MNVSQILYIFSKCFVILYQTSLFEWEHGVSDTPQIFINNSVPHYTHEQFHYYYKFFLKNEVKYRVEKLANFQCLVELEYGWSPIQTHIFYAPRLGFVFPPSNYHHEADELDHNYPFKTYLLRFRVLFVETCNDPRCWTNWIASISNWGLGDMSMAHRIIVELASDKDNLKSNVWLMCKFCHPKFFTLLRFDNFATFYDVYNAFSNSDALANQISWEIKDPATWYQVLNGLAPKSKGETPACFEIRKYHHQRCVPVEYILLKAVITSISTYRNVTIHSTTNSFGENVRSGFGKTQGFNQKVTTQGF
ncbi:hypothetical protein Fcan01_16079 [Folsomia candida]|uniref:Uncharacterized protein n=1 Tax=Folsomia candida TaxID=158441 RepID=A0A226DWD5_FOLCA|nr:hypothetical protein Fcan01_16079 [Folsomia candida]